MTEEQIDYANSILDKHGFEERHLTWKQLATEANANVSGRTIKRYMYILDYHKCIAWSESWANHALRKERLEFAKKALEERPNLENNYNIQCSDDCHLNYGPEGMAWIIRKPVTRSCTNCIQCRERRPEKEEKQRFRI